MRIAADHGRHLKMCDLAVHRDRVLPADDTAIIRPDWVLESGIVSRTFVATARQGVVDCSRTGMGKACLIPT